LSYDDDYNSDDEYADTEELLRGLRKDMRKASRQSQETDKQLIEAFTRVASAIEKLTAEVRGLREDLSPQLDKPKKLPAPGQGG